MAAATILVNGRRRDVLAVLYLVAVIALSYWPLTSMQGVPITDDVFTCDLQNEGLAFRHALGEAIRKGEGPFWIPEIYGGVPLLAQPNAGAAYPPGVVLFGLCDSYTALNLLLLFTLLTAALGMYALAKVLTRSTAGALVAALAFTYSGYMVCRLKYLALCTAASWFPLGLLSLELCARRRVSGPLRGLAVVFAMQLLSGGIQTAYYSGLVYAGYALLRLPIARAVLAGGACLLGAGIAAVHLVPAFELTRLGQRAGGVTFEYASAFAYDLRNFWTFFVPYVNGDPGEGTYHGKSLFWEDYGYVGLVTLCLVVIGVTRVRRASLVRGYLSMAVLGYMVVLGSNTPLYRLIHVALPGMKYFRFPNRFLFVVCAALAVLAAFGFRRLQAWSARREAGRRRGREAIGILVVLLVTLDLLVVQLRQNAFVDAATWREAPAIVGKLREDRDSYRIHSPGAAGLHRAAYLVAQGWSGDLLPYIEARETLQPSSNIQHGVPAADGYYQLTPGYLVDIWGDQNRPGLIQGLSTIQDRRLVPHPAYEKVLSLFHVKYLLSAWEIVGGPFEAMEKVGPVRMYRNPDVLPRAFVVGAVRTVADRGAALETLIAPGFDPRREMILEVDELVKLASADPAAVASPGAGATEANIVVERSARNEVQLRVRCEAPGYLVLTDAYYPSWEATVNGTATPILRVNIAQRAVKIPAGDDTVVRFRFVPRTIRIGAAISLLSILGLLFLFLRASRSRETAGARGGPRE